MTDARAHPQLQRGLVNLAGPSAGPHELVEGRDHRLSKEAVLWRVSQVALARGLETFDATGQPPQPSSTVAAGKGVC